MCTLAIYFQVSERYPLAIAANRDEYLARPASAPAPDGRAPWVVCGRDLIAGGTWLGVNQHGVVAGILNRRTDRRPNPQLRSRGLLCREALNCRSAVQALAQAGQDHAGYNPFNFLLVDATAAYVVSNHDGWTVTQLPAGVHLISNLDLNDPTCPRIAKSHRLFEAAAPLLSGDDLAPFRREMQTILADHSTPLDPRASGPPSNLCVHLGPYGTRCSSIVAAEARGDSARLRMWHADGPPCTTSYEEVELLVSS